VPLQPTTAWHDEWDQCSWLAELNPCHNIPYSLAGANDCILLDEPCGGRKAMKPIVGIM